MRKTNITYGYFTWQSGTFHHVVTLPRAFKKKKSRVLNSVHVLKYCFTAETLLLLVPSTIFLNCSALRRAWISCSKIQKLLLKELNLIGQVNWGKGDACGGVNCWTGCQNGEGNWETQNFLESRMVKFFK